MSPHDKELTGDEMTTREVAAIAGVTTVTINKWVKDGKLSADTSNRRNWIFHRATVIDEIATIKGNDEPTEFAREIVTGEGAAEAAAEETDDPIELTDTERLAAIREHAIRKATMSYRRVWMKMATAAEEVSDEEMQIACLREWVKAKRGIPAALGAEESQGDLE